QRRIRQNIESRLTRTQRIDCFSKFGGANIALNRWLALGPGHMDFMVMRPGESLDREVRIILLLDDEVTKK
ncbi:hypothetical protein Q8G71_36765, partial [Klebsiella pneumoniae]